jgi:hypothetical protein
MKFYSKYLKEIFYLRNYEQITIILRWVYKRYNVGMLT